MTKTELDAILGGLWPGLMKAVAQAIHDETQVLAHRVNVLEATSLKYRGTHQRSQAYMRNDAVTFGGALWVCVADNVTEIPGKGSAWQLANKSHAS